MSDKNQTAVEWLANNIADFLEDEQKTKILPMYLKAKELERYQICDAYYSGGKDMATDGVKPSALNYYSQTYNT